MIVMRTRPLVPRALLPLIAALAAAACAAPSLQERYGSAMTYAQFAAADTTRQAEWRASEARAAAAAAPFVERVRALPRPLRLLVVADNSCGDAINSVPYLAALDSATPNLEMRIVRKEGADALFDGHELDGRKATPLVLILDERYAEKGAWIERPAALRDHLKRTCTSDEKAVLRQWRTADAGRSVLAEVTTLLGAAAAAR
ncbi:MAG TPA: thioredoxin family protein [Gemmatimonadaceae bacterium]|nr:thioredoxin family protein [Gemmatimonadaceae bacterium]